MKLLLVIYSSSSFSRFCLILLEFLENCLKILKELSLCSEEEARMKIYSISTRHYFALTARLVVVNKLR